MKSMQYYIAGFVLGVCYIHVYIYIYMYVYMYIYRESKTEINAQKSLQLQCWVCFQCERYRVAMIGRLLKIVGLFCKRALSKRRYSAKETYDFKKPANRSHPIGV